MPGVENVAHLGGEFFEVGVHRSAFSVDDRVGLVGRELALLAARRILGDGWRTGAGDARLRLGQLGGAACHATDF
jgi:hypothetical protein